MSSVGCFESQFSETAIPSVFPSREQIETVFPAPPFDRLIPENVESDTERRFGAHGLRRVCLAEQVSPALIMIAPYRPCHQPSTFLYARCDFPLTITI
jgi:hypothetical protein